MELDDFKRKKFSFQDQEAEYRQESEVSVDNLISVFRAYQKKHIRKVFVMIVINTFLAVAYLSYVSHQAGPVATGYLLMGGGVLAGAIYLFFRYRNFSTAIYSLPVAEFLHKAEKKISYFNLTDYLIVVPILILLGTGGGIVFVTSILKYTDNKSLLILIWVIFFIALSVFAFVASHKNWEKEYGALFQRIVKLKKEYEEEGSL